MADEALHHTREKTSGTQGSLILALWIKFSFLLLLGMVMYDKEFETK